MQNINHESKSKETYKKELNTFFSDLNIILDAENLTVLDIVSFYIELCESIEELGKYINLQDDNIKKIKQCYLNLKNNREAADILSEEEKKQMKIDLSDAHTTIIKQLESIK